MKKIWKSAAALLIVCILMFGMGVGQLLGAGEIMDPTKTGKITVTIPQEVGEDLVADIYLIASSDKATADNMLIYDPVAPFPDPNGLDLTDKNVEARFAQEVAKILWNTGADPDWTVDLSTPDNDDANPHYFGATDEVVTPGLYVVIVHHKNDSNPEDYFRTDSEGNVYIATPNTENEGTFWNILPHLVSLPYYDSGENAGWKYAQSVYIKPGDIEPEDPNKPINSSVTLHKVSSEDTDLGLPGAEFKLYTAWPIPDPVTDTKEVYVEGMGKITLYFQPSTLNSEGTYTTDENGKLTIELPKEQNGMTGEYDYLPPYTLCALEEVKAPEGYQLKEDLYYFYARDLGIEQGVDDSGEPIYQYVGGDRGVSTVPREKGLIWLNGDTYYGEARRTFVIKNPYEQPVWVRVRVYSTSDNDFNSDNPEWTRMADDAWWYYVADPETPYLDINAVTEEFRSIGDTAVVVYEMTPVIFNDRGGFDQLWDWDPDSGIEIWRDVASNYPQIAHLLASGEEMTIENDPEEPSVSDLPEVGGPGTAVFVTVGGMLFAAALILFAVGMRAKSSAV